MRGSAPHQPHQQPRAALAEALGLRDPGRSWHVDRGPIQRIADWLAGVWAHHADRARQVLEAGDIEEGLGAASAIGDDRLQKRSQGYAVPDSFTHGSSQQRVRWFRRGLEGGELRACDTFKADQL